MRTFRVLFKTQFAATNFGSCTSEPDAKPHNTARVAHRRRNTLESQDYPCVKQRPKAQRTRKASIKINDLAPGACGSVMPSWNSLSWKLYLSKIPRCHSLLKRVAKLVDQERWKDLTSGTTCLAKWLKLIGLWLTGR